MTIPFYVSPEQLMKDRADFARKGIARGRSVVVLTYDGGIVFVADNPSRMRKVSEIYDRIGFAAVGKYNEFENLRVAGVRYADLRGYSYHRADVTARALANAYAQTLGTVFTQESKPYEVELVVAEVGTVAAEDQIYRLLFDGSVADQQGFVAIGGESSRIMGDLAKRWHQGMPLADAVGLAVELLARDPNSDRLEPGPGPDHLEVAVLERDRPRRAFRRLGPEQVGTLIAQAGMPGAPEAAAGAGARNEATAGTSAPAAAGLDDEPGPPVASPKGDRVDG